MKNQLSGRTELLPGLGESVYRGDIEGQGSIWGEGGKLNRGTRVVVDYW